MNSANPPANPTKIVGPAARLRGLAPYEPPPRSTLVEIALDANEGAPPSEALLDAFGSVTPEDLCRYPNAHAIEAQIAQRWRIEPERVVVTNGGDDAIDRICRSVLEPGRDMVAHTPSFPMIERSARLAGADVQTVEWMDGEFPIKRFIQAIGPGTALVALVSPNNPTGGVITAHGMRSVVRAAAAIGAVTLIDLAYVEFADEDPTDWLQNEPNVVIVRTFSKAMGLAGLRVGYAIAPPEIARWLRTAGGPYPVSSVSLAVASASLANRQDRIGFITRVREERECLTAALRGAGIDLLDSHANFVTCRFPNPQFVSQALISLGISVRRIPCAPGGGLVRITLPGDDRSFSRLLHAALCACKPQALLLDLDGVLADVSGSYRQAIIATAATYGIRVWPDEIAALKRAGSSNNDWELARRLLESKGMSVDIAEVTERFQQAYLGADGSRGLRENEALIPSAELLRRIARLMPLAIVTGRPRSEAEWFLRCAGIGDLFRVRVCLEDAAQKPSQEPVRLALRRLGVERAWMIGDTPDDMAAARAARVIPIGIPAPGDDQEPACEALKQAGAAKVVTDLAAVEEMLS
jgi:histidinol-phosphate aminotransferase